MESGPADSADGHFSGLDIVGPYADLDIALAVRDDRGHGAAFVSLAERNAVAFRGARIAASDSGEMACAGDLNMQGTGVAGDASAVFIDRSLDGQPTRQALRAFRWCTAEQTRPFLRRGRPRLPACRVHRGYPWKR